MSNDYLNDYFGEMNRKQDHGAASLYAQNQEQERRRREQSQSVTNYEAPARFRGWNGSVPVATRHNGPAVPMTSRDKRILWLVLLSLGFVPCIFGWTVSSIQNHNKERDATIAIQTIHAEMQAQSKPLTPQMLRTVVAFNTKQFRSGYAVCEHPEYLHATYYAYTFQDVSIEFTEHCMSSFRDHPGGFRHGTAQLNRFKSSDPWRVSGFGVDSKPLNDVR